GWPLRSPRHLVVTLIGVVILAVVIGIVAAHLHGPAKPAATGSAALDTTTNGSTATSGTAGSGTAASTGPTTSSTPVTRLAGPPETPVSAPPAPAALDVIRTWGKLWVNHPVGMTNQQWLAQLTPYTTPELLLGPMSSVDVANIDPTQVTGAPIATQSFTDSVEALLPTNAGQLDVTAIDTPQGWLVSSYTGGS
ncbi:MAG TPA: hypothetical protein VH333_01575, partial [Pseudonocardiaceae bacterium]|nr:hypothetical protein [Pseudonocardiaceae bacterium]